MLTNSPDCSTCLFSWYGRLITVGGVGGVGGDFSQTQSIGLSKNRNSWNPRNPPKFTKSSIY